MRAMGMGIYYCDQCSLKLRDNIFVENTVSTLSFVALPSVMYHQYAAKYQHFTNNLVIGQSPWFDCATDGTYQTEFAEDIRGLGSGKPYNLGLDGSSMVGFSIPSFLSKYILTPGKSFTVTKAYPALWGTSTFTGKSLIYVSTA